MAGTFTNLVYHIIFSTKDREAVLDPETRRELYAYMGGIVREQDGRLLAAGGVADHVHLLALFPAKTAVSDMLREVKSGSSAWLNGRRRVKGRFSWQGGYGAFTVSESAKADVTRYIAGQEEHHRTRTFQEEFVAFLDRHGLSYDPRYLWE